MADADSPTPSESSVSAASSGPPPTAPGITLSQPKKKGHHAVKRAKPFRTIRSLLRTFPIFTPACRFHAAGLTGRSTRPSADGHVSGATRVTGTLFGRRKSRVTLAVQEGPRAVPVLLLELSMPTGKFMQDLGADSLRMALECEKKPAPAGEKAAKLLEEPLWTAFVNGRKIGYGVRREATEADLEVLQTLHAVSMGAGVLPEETAGAGAGAEQGEMTYMRAHFDRVVGSKDSETFYMLNPDGNNGPELSIFFVRV